MAKNVIICLTLLCVLVFCGNSIAPLLKKSRVVCQLQAKVSLLFTSFISTLLYRWDRHYQIPVWALFSLWSSQNNSLGSGKSAERTKHSLTLKNRLNVIEANSALFPEISNPNCNNTLWMMYSTLTLSLTHTHTRTHTHTHPQTHTTNLHY